MASFFPQTFRDIDVIRLNNITVFNANNTLPSTGTVLTVSSGKAYMLSLTTALEAIGISSLSTQLSTLSNVASNWSYYPALSTVNMNLNNMSNFNKLQGQYCTASGEESFAIGNAAVASGDISFAFGGGQATNINSVAFFGTASGESSVSLGGNASGFAAISFSGTASGPRAFSLGNSTVASGANSFAEGDGSRAEGISSHAEGIECTASGAASHAEGSGTRSSANQSHTEGYLTYVASLASYGHAEGQFTQVQGEAGHAEGFSTIAGSALGSNAHAEGYWTIATGANSHSQGIRTEANAEASFAAGVSSIASNYADTVIGYGGHSRLPINFVLGGGPVQNTVPENVYGGAQFTMFNISAQCPAVIGGSYEQFPLQYPTSTVATESNIPFVSLADTNTVAIQYTVKLTGYQQPTDNNIAGDGISYSEYTFLTYIDSIGTPTILCSDGTVISGPSSDNILPSDKLIFKFGNGISGLDPNPTQLLADIIVADTNILVLKVNTGSLTKANWIANVQRSEIAQPYY